MNDEIIYHYVKDKGWVAGYKSMQPVEVRDMQRILRELVVQHYEPIIREVTVVGTVEI